MTKSGKFVLVALVASLTMAFAVSSASANRLSINGADFEIIWPGLRLVPPIGDTVVCAVTLLGHFHSLTITKTLGSLIGTVDHVRLGACTGGSATILTETLPWHTQYGGFRGRLPAITAGILNLIGAAFQINNDTASCLAVTSTTEPGIGTGALNETGRVTGLQASGSIDLTGPELCDFLGANGAFEGSASVTHLEGDPIIIRLV